MSLRRYGDVRDSAVTAVHTAWPTMPPQLVVYLGTCQWPEPWRWQTRRYPWAAPWSLACIEPARSNSRGRYEPNGASARARHQADGHAAINTEYPQPGA